MAKNTTVHRKLKNYTIIKTIVLNKPQQNSNKTTMNKLSNTCNKARSISETALSTRMTARATLKLWSGILFTSCGDWRVVRSVRDLKLVGLSGAPCKSNPYRTDTIPINSVCWRVGNNWVGSFSNLVVDISRRFLLCCDVFEAVDGVWLSGSNLFLININILHTL